MVNLFLKVLFKQIFTRNKWLKMCLQNSSRKAKISWSVLMRWRIIYPLKFSATLYLNIAKVKFPQFKKQSTSKS
ncbi:MAG: hypothetical protein V7785_19690, partial [Bermanella sp.]